MERTYLLRSVYSFLFSNIQDIKIVYVYIPSGQNHQTMYIILYI